VAAGGRGQGLGFRVHEMEGCAHPTELPWIWGEDAKMKTEPAPISGKEDPEALTPPLRALSQFYAAFNTRDLGKMAQNWAQVDEIAMDNPLGGIKRGWNDIQNAYKLIFSGPAQVSVEFYDYTLHQSQDIFYVVGRERGEFRLGETVVKLIIRTTRIFRRLGGEWKQVHHHGSIEDPDLLGRYQAAVKAASRNQ
jgi:ketosteroid isomerase-like protein